MSPCPPGRELHEPHAATAHLTVPVGSDDHARGPAAAPVTLVEYGDFECPACGEAFPIVEDVLARAGRAVRFVFRHFPLATVHPHAELAAEAAEAAEAAAAQGRFWQMHALLYENQDALGPADLVRYAAALGLAAGRFVADLDGRAHAARVRADFLGGARSGVNGTPTFFVNGARHDGPFDLGSLLGAVEGEIAVGRR